MVLLISPISSFCWHERDSGTVASGTTPPAIPIPLVGVELSGRHDPCGVLASGLPVRPNGEGTPTTRDRLRPPGGSASDVLTIPRRRHARAVLHPQRRRRQHQLPHIGTLQPSRLSASGEPPLVGFGKAPCNTWTLPCDRRLHRLGNSQDCRRRSARAAPPRRGHNSW
jgi:hypothetical protein